MIVGKEKDSMEHKKQDVINDFGFIYSYDYRIIELLIACLKYSII